MAEDETRRSRHLEEAGQQSAAASSVAPTADPPAPTAAAFGAAVHRPVDQPLMLPRGQPTDRRLRHSAIATDFLTRCRNFRNVWKKHGPSPWIPLPAPFTFPVQQRGERVG